MLLIGLWVFHPDNKKVYESYANIPLEDLLEDETSNENDSKTYFSIFL
jgi:cbb3-type cytochrome oxidase subunit 3